MVHEIIEKYSDFYLYNITRYTMSLTIRKLCYFMILPAVISILMIAPSYISDKIIYGASPFGNPDKAVIFTAGGRAFQFDVDYAIVGGDQGEVVMKRGLHVTGGVTPVIGQQADGMFHLFVTKDKIKVRNLPLNSGRFMIWRIS